MLASINPKTGERGPDVEACSLDDVAGAARRAGAVAPVWAATPAGERARLLRAAADALDADRADIVARRRLRDRTRRAALPRRTRPHGAGSCGCSPTSSRAVRTSRPSSRRPIRSATPPRPDLRRMLVPLGPVGRLLSEQLPAGLRRAGRRHGERPGRRVPGRRERAPVASAHVGRLRARLRRRGGQGRRAVGPPVGSAERRPRRVSRGRQRAGNRRRRLHGIAGRRPPPV